MRLENAFTIDAAPDRVWATMLDFERVAGCVPGSQVVGPTDDGGFEADIRVKVGPMAMTYRGVVKIVEQDPEARRAVMEAKARESRGQGTAAAQMVMNVRAGTPVDVTIVTELQITGRVAQMGHGVMQDVAARIVSQFADNLRDLVGGPGATGDAPAVPPPAPGDVAEPSAPSRHEPAAPRSDADLGLGTLLAAVGRGRLRALRRWLASRLGRRRR